MSYYFTPEAESEIYDLEPIMQAKVLKGLEKAGS